MMNNTSENISLPPMLQSFSKLQDPRVEGRCTHRLEDVLAICFCAILSGARHLTQIEKFGRLRKEWFKRFLVLPNGVPSHDTIGRVLAKIDPENFLDCFNDWLKLIGLSKSTMIALDGKTLRATHGRSQGLKPAHIVNAFDTHSKIILSQHRVPDKTNEIKAIPAIIKKMDVEGALVTIDAMGCQQGIAKLLKNKGAEYIFNVKGNQGNLHKTLKKTFFKATEYGYNAMVFKEEKTKDYGHGRIEEREYTVLPQCYVHPLTKRWPGLQSIIQVKRTRLSSNNDEGSVSTHYYISSLQLKEYKRIATGIRFHWRIENNCHWMLDNTFREDRCCVRTKYAPENLSLLRKWVLSLLKIKRRGKLSIEAMLLESGWDARFTSRLLS